MNKYYIQTSKTSQGPYSSSIYYYHPNLMVEVNLNTYFTNIEVTFDKLKTKRFVKPASTEYTLVRPALEESYKKYLKESLESLRAATWEEAEYYQIPGDRVLELMMYSLDKNSQYYISLKIYNDFDYGSVEISKNTSFTRRRWYRNHGVAITKEKFRQALELVYSYILDESSYELNIDRLETKMKFLLNDEQGENVILSIHHTDFVNQLERKKQQIQTRLIDNDSDTPVDRAFLRGELSGIEYSIRAYKQETI